jgi:RimJ/RimL family protein N-acetyltransferase
MNNMTNGKRIKIRRKRLSDAKEDYAWQTDAELSRLDAASPLEMTYQQYLSEYTFELSYPSPSRHEFAVDTLTGEHIGNCVYYNISQHENKAEMGIMIGNRNYWNQGYGFEIVNALLDHIFNNTELQNIYLTTLTWNIRAQKCFKKCGFKECGLVNRDHHTFLLMLIHRDEWAKLQVQTSNEETIKSSINLSPNK